ncbi:hypothetical protein GGR56DRAFT_639259 [Xylariaceae sp. FL0804]|nr:hypothetical protein GGR56DRAFT_639259 [Xylariaceae sp. FL0804]
MTARCLSTYLAIIFSTVLQHTYSQKPQLRYQEYIVLRCRKSAPSGGAKKASSYPTSYVHSDPFKSFPAKPHTLPVRLRAQLPA